MNSTATTEQVGANPTAMQASANGLAAMMVKYFSGYHGSSNSNDFDFSYPGLMISQDTSAGELIICGSTYYDWFQYWAKAVYINDATTRAYTVWSTYYQYVLCANNLIRAIDPETENALERGYLGMAYAFRAFSYLQMAQLYEFKAPTDPSVKSSYVPDNAAVATERLTVPIVTEETTEEESFNNPRAPHDRMYAFILSDLDKAEAFLSAGEQESRLLPCLDVAYGLKARYYLLLGDEVSGGYALAAEYARKARQAFGGSPLTRDQWENPTTGFNNYAANSNSWMWYVAVPKESVYINANFIAHMCTEQVWNPYGYSTSRGINRNLYDKIPDTDFRKHSWIDPGRMGYYAYKTNRDIDSPSDETYYIATYGNLKFRPVGGELSQYVESGAVELPLMRLEEMYFIEAEALARSGDLGGARSLLASLIRTRNPQYDPSAASTLDDFVEELFTQKRIEFWGEGLILFDFKRLGAGAVMGYEGTNVPEGYRYNVTGPAPWWNWVIPRTELNTNTGLVGFNNPDPVKSVAEWKQ